MNDLLLLETVERYIKGEMTPQEKAFFEDLRKSNPEIDQVVVENTFILKELDKHANIKAYKHALTEVEGKLTEEGVMSKSQLKGKAKVSFMWKKYKRSIAVAASIAGIVSLVTTGLVVAYNNKAKQSDINQLRREIKEDVKKALNNFSATQPYTKSVIPEPTKFAGTGFIIDSRGYLVTNAHVISKMKNIYVENNKGEYFSVTTVYTDNACDLAVLRITDTANFKLANPIPYSIKKTNSDLGEQIFTLGYPRNDIVYGEGYLSAKSGNDGDSTAYQISVSANPGNSGAPVINKNGEVIGIITSKNSTADGVVYAAKSKNIFKLLDAIKKADETQNIKLPANSGLKGLDRTKQVEKMEEFVFMVVGN